ncbi:MAG: DUF2909 domain-containing protein [Glaciecola sp.]|jgi:uncharacterized membrane protein YedE/YeeE|nr:DUF2909 domain-containing protein [Glaciecola sp.]MDG1468313.1 DUF2909 domain-containing protein [Glaciecola sp.]MDG1922398.1 DUF2909 domain-containing protein [Glaciecola sp.]HAQ47568.1 DUF2909 domain-containing protein [Glaciecola sp.]HCF79581.1 DUF2909 domain-containing protein [Glaciecola sp.]
MLIKILIGSLLIIMIISLFQAMRVMLGSGKADTNMSKFIGRRVLLSAIIIGLIIIGVATGLIEANPRPY